KLFGIVVDFLGMPEKLLLIPKQVAVMIESLDIDLEPALPHGIQVCWRDLIALLGDDLKRRLDPKGIIDIHQGTREVLTSRCFNIMSNDGARSVAFRPEQDEGNTVKLPCLHRDHCQLSKEPLNSAIHWPRRKRQCLPAAQIDLLEMLPQGNRKEGAQQVIGLLDPLLLHPPPLARVVDITFVSQVVDN